MLGHRYRSQDAVQRPGCLKSRCWGPSNQQMCRFRASGTINGKIAHYSASVVLNRCAYVSANIPRNFDNSLKSVPKKLIGMRIHTAPVRGRPNCNSGSDRVEQRTENPRVGCSIHPLATILHVGFLGKRTPVSFFIASQALATTSCH